MGEPIVIYRAEDGEPLEVYGLAQKAALLAKGEYVLEPPAKGKAKKDAADVAKETATEQAQGKGPAEKAAPTKRGK
jgi:hypothetical protein